MIELGIPRSSGLPIVDEGDRFKHLFCLGTTGSGKTTFFLNLIEQEMDNAIIVLDPHGELADLVAGMVPKDRLVYVDKYHPISLNPLARDYLTKSEIASELRDIVNASVQAINPQQMEITMKMLRIIRQAIQTIDDNELTFEYLSQFLDSPNVREEFFQEHQKTTYWKEFDKKDYDAQQLRMSAGRVTDRFSLLHEDEIFVPFIGADNEFDIPEIIDERKVVVFNLGGMEDDTMTFLGNIISHQIKSYYRHQAKLDSKPLYFYVDEYHLFITSLFGRFLTECRKYNISCNFSGHNLHQVDKSLAQIMMDCHVVVALDVNPDDEDKLARKYKVKSLDTGGNEAMIGIGKDLHQVICFPPPDVEPYRPEPKKTEEGYYWLKEGWVMI